MANKSGKGSQFERNICKQLSLWWTRDVRDDIFWRSSQSGGRATIRKKSGKSTANSEGDIGLLDPIGQPLLDLFTIELKRGYGGWSVQDILEKKQSKFIEFWQQAQLADDGKRARTDKLSYPMLITKKDRCEPLVFVPKSFFSDFVRTNDVPSPYILIKYKETLIAGLPLINFLSDQTLDIIEGVLKCAVHSNGATIKG